MFKDLQQVTVIWKYLIYIDVKNKNGVILLWFNGDIYNWMGC